MGFRARKIHALNLLFLLAALFCAGTHLRAQDLSAGSSQGLNQPPVCRPLGVLTPKDFLAVALTCRLLVSVGG